jgi:dTMP kinase
MRKNKYPGKFIVFEGLDGSGQTTQAHLLKEFLSQKGCKVHLTKEPTSNLIGGLIRGQLQNEWKSSQDCLQLLFAADRAHHLEKEIIPLLKKGVIVISDRYFFSTIAYGAIEIKDWKWLLDINKNFLLPDIIFLLKTPPKICIKRIKTTRFEITLFEKEKILAKVLKNYLKLAKEFKNVYIIDGTKTVKEVAGEVQKVVRLKLNF